ncbi:MAG: type II toxin-antitoxin system YafQ family toxin [Fibromonadales bacterium]|nr:type II toxin-antitoxin system YafQ family toxin [Fibromonadales bacterium]
MLQLVTTKKYRKDLKLIAKQGKNLDLLNEVINTLKEQKPLDPKYKDHPLHGNYEGYRECHILSDWLFIYKINKKELILFAFRTGSHSELLKI